MLTKACPKCHGDLRVEPDFVGGPPDLVCLQCGYILRPQERAPVLARLRHPTRGRREARVGRHRTAA